MQSLLTTSGSRSSLNGRKVSGFQPRERKAVEDIVDALRCQGAVAIATILYLSGGNQQKAIIGRALAI